jgi:hypothetical protein
LTLAQLIDEVAESLRPLATVIPDLQVYGFWNDNPSPPSLDVYPGSPFQDGAGFGAGNNRVYLTVRARVSMADPEAGQKLLLRLLDPGDAASVEVALGNADAAVVPDGVAGFTQYADDTSAVERMLGCEWRVSRFL